MSKKKSRKFYFRTFKSVTIYNLKNYQTMMKFIEENWATMMRAHTEANVNKPTNVPGPITAETKLWKQIIATLKVPANTKAIMIMIDEPKNQFVSIQEKKTYGGKKAKVKEHASKEAN